MKRTSLVLRRPMIDETIWQTWKQQQPENLNNWLFLLLHNPHKHTDASLLGCLNLCVVHHFVRVCFSLPHCIKLYFSHLLKTKWQFLCVFCFSFVFHPFFFSFRSFFFCFPRPTYFHGSLHNLHNITRKMYIKQKMWWCGNWKRDRNPIGFAVNIICSCT